MSILKSPILLFFILAGLVVTSVSAWSIFTVYQSKSWPYIEDGRILEADCRDSGEGGKVRYVKYQYTVASQQFVNDREFFGLYTASKECTPGYSAGQFVTVFYNPANPSDSVLKSGDYRIAKYGLLFGLAFLISALLTHIFGRKKEALITTSTPPEKTVISSAEDDFENIETADKPTINNKILHQAPKLRSKNFICHQPALPMKMITGFFCVASLGILSTQISDWKDFSLLFSIFFLIPVVLIYPVLSKATRSQIYFWADKRGLFFPHSDGVLNAEQQQKKGWLLIPWQNVSNLRNAAIGSDDELRDSIAFDIKISPRERKEFFRKVYCPVDREQSFAKGTLSLGYAFGIQPPIADLFELMEQTTADETPNVEIMEETAVKNKIVSQMPILDNEHIIYDMPLSVVIIGKLGFGLGGLAFFVPVFADNHMELWAKVATCVAGAAFVICGVHPRAWYLRFFFLADKRGMFFPCSDGSPNSKQQKRHDWLFVPWKNIANMRMAQIGDSDSHGIAFDVRISPEEKNRFFAKAARPADRQELYVQGVLRVGYDSHPHPSIGSLLKLMG